MPADRDPFVLLPRRKGVDPRALVASLVPELGDAALVDLGEGWDNVVWQAGQTHLLRVSKEPHAAARRRAAVRDNANLRLARRYSSLPTNEVVALDPGEGAMVLTLVPGETANRRPPSDPNGLAATMGAFLTRLHTAPAVEVAAVLPRQPSVGQWHEETAASWSAAAHLLDRADGLAVTAFLSACLPEQPRRLVFCHSDLRDEHLVIDEVGAVAGVIDWSDAVWGDPALDLAALRLDFGAVVYEGVLAAYQGPTDPGLPDRVLWYAARAGIVDVAVLAQQHGPRLAVALGRLRDVLREGGWT